jgi:mRNA interferase MazF
MKTARKHRKINRGSIFYADLAGSTGSEQGGRRPVLVLQNAMGNKYSPTVIVAAITSKEKRMDLPTHVSIGTEYGLREVSIVMLEQIRTIDKKRLGRYVGQIDDSKMQAVDQALSISCGQVNPRKGVVNGKK